MFWKNRKPREPSYITNKNVLQNIARNVIDINGYDIEYKNVYEAHELQEIFEYIDINTAISTLVRGVTSRELIFTSEKGVVNDSQEKTLLEEGQRRLNNIKSKVNFIRELAKTPFLKITVHEVIYNENFEIERLDFIPRELIRYDKEKKEFYIQSKISEKIYLNNPMKWHISIYNEDVTKPYGETLLKPILKTYEEIKYIKGKMNGIIEKYGGTIVLFGYDPNLEDELVEKTGQELKRMMDKNTVGIPNAGGIKDSIVLLRLADLNIEIHNLLMEKLERKIFQNILGSTLTINDGSANGNGTQALGTIHQEEKEKIEDEIALFVREELDKIIDIDGLIHGYDPNQYYIEINRQQDRKKELEIKNLEQDEVNKKADQIVKLSQAGYEIDETELQEVFGYKSLKKKDEQQPNNPFTEFSKKNTEDSNKKTTEYMERLRKQIVPEISKKIADQIKNITSIEDIRTIDTGTKNHENSLILSELWGQYLTIKDRSKTAEYKKKSEFAVYSEIDLQDIFNMTFNEAINWLLNREPQTYDQIQRVMERYRTNYFWIKRSTDLEVTKTLYSELLKNLELGQTFEDFKKNIDIESLGFGKDGYYLRQVFDQTMINAQSVGQWEQLQEGMQYGFIYGLYDAILDGRETDLCRQLDGKVYRLDSPFWEVYYPPNHFRCRSRVTALSEEDMTNYGYRAESGEIGTNPQKGFDKNIGSNYISGIKRYVNQKEKEAEELYKKVSNYEG
ncbi:phage minor head protein [Sebaldella sp. S0638]|uniref:phage portal protein family protein n=1 Tax=Sebaldella sp. S0638 TaxID=2957809 RepID=UPI00209EBDFF|nr:DUF935 family protein [Sebaldella sp. S0638]MCP1225686.1 phage minor head protein [Sebaldella sp. S0638]